MTKEAFAMVKIDAWGTSRALAADLMASSRCCGRRSKMVFVDGLWLGSTTRCAFAQSRRRVASRPSVSQNARSCAPVLNLGSGLPRSAVTVSGSSARREVLRSPHPASTALHSHALQWRR